MSNPTIKLPETGHIELSVPAFFIHHTEKGGWKLVKPLTKSRTIANRQGEKIITFVPKNITAVEAHTDPQEFPKMLDFSKNDQERLKKYVERFGRVVKPKENKPRGRPVVLQKNAEYHGVKVSVKQRRRSVSSSEEEMEGGALKKKKKRKPRKRTAPPPQNLLREDTLRLSDVFPQAQLRNNPLLKDIGIPKGQREVIVRTAGGLSPRDRHFGILEAVNPRTGAVLIEQGREGGVEFEDDDKSLVSQGTPISPSDLQGYKEQTSAVREAEQAIREVQRALSPARPEVEAVLQEDADDSLKEEQSAPIMDLPPAPQSPPRQVVWTREELSKLTGKELKDIQKKYAQYSGNRPDGKKHNANIATMIEFLEGKQKQALTSPAPPTPKQPVTPEEKEEREDLQEKKEGEVIRRRDERNALPKVIATFQNAYYEEWAITDKGEVLELAKSKRFIVVKEEGSIKDAFDWLLKDRKRDLFVTNYTYNQSLYRNKEEDKLKEYGLSLKVPSEDVLKIFYVNWFDNTDAYAQMIHNEAEIGKEPLEEPPAPAPSPPPPSPPVALTRGRSGSVSSAESRSSRGTSPRGLEVPRPKIRYGKQDIVKVYMGTDKEKATADGRKLIHDNAEGYKDYLMGIIRFQQQRNQRTGRARAEGGGETIEYRLLEPKIKDVSIYFDGDVVAVLKDVGGIKQGSYSFDDFINVQNIKELYGLPKVDIQISPTFSQEQLDKLQKAITDAMPLYEARAEEEIAPVPAPRDVVRFQAEAEDISTLPTASTIGDDAGKEVRKSGKQRNVEEAIRVLGEVGTDEAGLLAIALRDAKERKDRQRLNDVFDAVFLYGRYLNPAYEAEVEEELRTGMSNLGGEARGVKTFKEIVEEEESSREEEPRGRSGFYASALGEEVGQESQEYVGSPLTEASYASESEFQESDPFNEGSGLFDKIKWGTFTAQWKRSGQKGTLEDFAKHVLKYPHLHTGHTRRRAEFYLNVLKKPQGHGFKDPCWKGYEMIGMKMKRGRKVPNCVKGTGFVFGGDAMNINEPHDIESDGASTGSDDEEEIAQIKSKGNYMAFHPALATQQHFRHPNAQSNVHALSGGLLKDDLQDAFKKVVPKSLRPAVSDLGNQSAKYIGRRVQPRAEKAYKKVVPKSLRPAVGELGKDALAYARRQTGFGLLGMKGGMGNGMEGYGMEAGALGAKRYLKEQMKSVVPKALQSSVKDLAKAGAREILHSNAVQDNVSKAREMYNDAKEKYEGAVPKEVRQSVGKVAKAMTHPLHPAGRGMMKGSPEMKEHMAKLRAMRKKKMKGGMLEAEPPRSRSSVTAPELTGGDLPPRSRLP